ncbi:hypothetical protein JAU75_10715 [Ochrobactrum sp. Q0168]|uniref:hypothetical protein n=1 Tax=Ochrobactrum sp. Q0168 TaxID=2793241 RepID=UPI0018ED32F9|nr:hypothetical protein [Ochrobactrum sp. Q0168]
MGRKKPVGRRARAACTGYGLKRDESSEDLTEGTGISQQAEAGKPPRIEARGSKGITSPK